MDLGVIKLNSDDTITYGWADPGVVDGAYALIQRFVVLLLSSNVCSFREGIRDNEQQTIKAGIAAALKKVNTGSTTIQHTASDYSSNTFSFELTSGQIFVLSL